MAWFYLLIAAIFEVGWPFGLKMAAFGSNKLFWILFAIVSMTLSGVFLFLAHRTIPVGSPYFFFFCIGSSCTFLFGVIIFHDAFSLMRAFGILLIIAGVILLKIGH